MLNQRILKKHGDEPINALELYSPGQPTEVFNEYLDTILKRETAETGYKKFHLKDILFCYFGLEAYVSPKPGSLLIVWIDEMRWD